MLGDGFVDVLDDFDAEDEGEIFGIQS